MELAGSSCVVLVQVFWLCMGGLVLASIALSGLLTPLLLSLLEDCKTKTKQTNILTGALPGKLK